MISNLSSHDVIRPRISIIESHIDLSDACVHLFEDVPSR